jgi:hypothetical protein
MYVLTKKNEACAARARAVLTAYALHLNETRPIDGDTARDLIQDLMHWAQADQPDETDGPFYGRMVIKRAFDDAYTDFPKEGAGR